MYLHPKPKTVLLYLLAKNRGRLNETTLNQTNLTVVYNPHIGTNKWVPQMTTQLTSYLYKNNLVTWLESNYLNGLEMFTSVYTKKSPEISMP